MITNKRQKTLLIVYFGQQTNRAHKRTKQKKKLRRNIYLVIDGLYATAVVNVPAYPIV